MDIATVAVKHVIEKIKRGKRLTAEDILILHLGTISEDVRAMRAEAAEREKALREVYARFDTTDAKIDALYAEMNRRFDELYQLLITALTQKRES